MIIGVPKERRPYEFRVGLPPSGISLFTAYDHIVYVERGAGVGAGFSDDDYTQAGAVIAYSEDEVLGRADVVLKFARPLAEELELLRERQTLLGFFHMEAARQEKIEVLMRKRITTIAYELIEDDGGYFPVLAPASQLGGRLVVQVAARLMQNDFGGRGILLGNIVGAPPPEVVIIGAGMVGGTAAATFALSGAHVTVLDIDLRRLQTLQAESSMSMVTMLATPYNIRRACSYADIVVGAVYVPGERAPIVLSREIISRMKRRAIVIDMAIDSGGCFETSRPTSHGSPTYIDEGVIHCCVPNLPGVLGRTGTHLLFTAAYPYLEAIAKMGVEKALQEIPALERGVNTYQGQIKHLNRLVDVGSSYT